MARHRGDFTRLRVQVDRMAAAFSEQATAMGFQMPDQVDALHARLSRQSLSDHAHADEVFLGQRSIRLEYEIDGLTQICTRLGKCLAL